MNWNWLINFMNTPLGLMLLSVLIIPTVYKIGTRLMALPSDKTKAELEAKNTYRELWIDTKEDLEKTKNEIKQLQIDFIGIRNLANMNEIEFEKSKKKIEILEKENLEFRLEISKMKSKFKSLNEALDKYKDKYNKAIHWIKDTCTIASRENIKLSNLDSEVIEDVRKIEL